MPVSPIVFFFDFTSPYAYLASTLIEALALAHERGIEWVPMLLGPVLAATGAKPLLDVPLKGDYARIDIPRSARYFGVPYAQPQPFPIATHHAARVLLGLQRDDPERARTWIHGVYTAYFAHGRNIADRAVLHALAAEHDIDPGRVDVWCEEPALKDALRANVDRALRSGVCGAPFFIVDDEPFWGVDRLPQMDRWLRGRY